MHDMTTPLLQRTNDLIRQVASIEEDNLVVFYQIGMLGPIRGGGLRWEGHYKRGDTVSSNINLS